MNTPCETEFLNNSTNNMVSFSSNYAIGEHNMATSNVQNMTQPTFCTRMAMRISRSKWFNFLRRVFHYQNGPRSNLGSNPFDSSTWMMLELIALLVQITSTTFTLVISKSEKPLWPMRVWIVGYDIGCVLNLLLLCGRYYHQIIDLNHGDDAFGFSDMEQQSNHEENSEYRSTHLMSKCKSSLDLFFAIWFVMGNVWSFDSRFGTLQQAPKLQILCIILLIWNAICYSFPFLLFLLLCCFVPLISTLLGYNMNIGSSSRGASDDQISQLPFWRYKVDHSNNLLDLSSNDPQCERLIREEPECCICLAKYKDKEEIRELPCSHMFHLKCVDQWLRIISCCPLCKQGLQRRSIERKNMNPNVEQKPPKMNVNFPEIDMNTFKKHSHMLVSPRAQQAAVKKSPSGRMNCLCSPTTHAGSFRCRHHRSTSGGMHRGGSVGSNLYELGNKSGDISGSPQAQ